MRLLGLILLIGLLSCREPSVLAGTYTAATCNVADVNGLINNTGGSQQHQAVDGDVIIIPAGSCTWATGVVVPTGIGITITGVGNPTADPTVTGPDPSCSQTVITQTVAVRTIAFTETPSFGSSTSRISCMAINYGSGLAIAISILGACTTSGCPNMRWDNLSFNNWTGHTQAGISTGITVIGDMFGVVDHNAMFGIKNGAGYAFTQLSHARFLGAGTYGDNSWAQPAGFGSANWLFWENNHFLNVDSMDDEGNAGGLSTEGGTRPVLRYNKWDGLGAGTTGMSWHGTETNGRPRSGRAWESYGNTWNCDLPGNNCAGLGGPRGGTGYIWGNTVIQLFTGRVGALWSLATYRSFGNPGWGACDGTAPYDTNDGVTYYSDTVASITTGRNPTVTVSGTPGWTVNQWSPLGAPYSLHDVTLNTGTEIISNGSNTLVINVGSGGPGDWRPAVGDSIQILRATVCIDQAGGRGAGFPYTGTGSNGYASPLVPANQVPEPIYAWMNTSSVGTPQQIIASNTLRVIGGRDWYTESMNQAGQTSPTMPFSGTSTLGAVGGIGHGTLANRPTTCTQGTAYWATDIGNWNLAPGGTQGQLYICTATNAWTLSYTPYTYPHPLDRATPPVAGGYTGTLAGTFH